MHILYINNKQTIHFFLILSQQRSKVREAEHHFRSALASWAKGDGNESLLLAQCFMHLSDTLRLSGNQMRYVLVCLWNIYPCGWSCGCGIIIKKKGIIKLERWIDTNQQRQQQQKRRLYFGNISFYLFFAIGSSRE